MMSDETPTTAQTPTSPAGPYEAYSDDREAVESSWPIVIGVLCAIYGAIGMLVYGFATVVVLFAPLIEKVTGRPSATPEEMKAITSTQSIVLFVLGAVLLYGAVGLLRRRPRGYRVVLGWAAARLIFALVQVAVSFATIDMTARVQVAQYRKQMDALNDQERAAALSFMKSVGMNEPTVESVRASAPKYIALTTGGFAVWPVLVGIMLTGRRCRSHVAAWRRAESSQGQKA